MAKGRKITTYREFWPFYLSEHSNPVNCRLHYVGTTIAFALIVAAVVTADVRFLLGALFSGYGFAWFGHFFIEKRGLYALETVPWDRFDRSRVHPQLLAFARGACLFEFNADTYSDYLCRVFGGDREMQSQIRAWAEEEK
jgi:hypothetical protein